MDPNETYRLWWRAVLEENYEEACEHYGSLKTWLECGGFEPSAFDNPLARKQFFTFNPRTGRIE